MDRILLRGVGLDPLTQAGVCAKVTSAIAAGGGGLIVTPNLDHLRRLQGDDPMAPTYRRAALVLADGMPVVWAARLQGTPIPERVAGSDLLWSLSAAAATAGVGVALIGGADGSADRAARRLAEHAPGLHVRFTACPSLPGVPVPEDVAALAADLVTSIGNEPHIIFTGLGSPKQEVVNLLLADRLPQCWFVGVGAAIDMAAGVVSRAPKWAHTAGVEWIFRLAQEPRRLRRRYLLEGVPFAIRLLASAFWTRLVTARS